MLIFSQSVLWRPGAKDSFIDSALLEQALIPIEALNAPKTVNALDGRHLATVTHRKLPITVTDSGSHCKFFRLFVIPSPTFPVILGLPWLKLLNPHIDGSLHF